MPYVGGEMASLFDPELAQDAAEACASAVGDRGHELAAEFTPVDTGNLRTAWYRQPAVGARRTRRGGVPGYVVEVKNDVSYALEVEEGTGIWGPKGARYPIEPRTAPVLSWVTKRPFVDKRTGRVVPTGTRVFAKRVMHPGSRGRHMMARAATQVQATLDVICEPVLAAWAREQERRAD